MIYPLQQNTYFIQQPNWQCNQHKCEYIRIMRTAIIKTATIVCFMSQRINIKSNNSKNLKNQYNTSNSNDIIFR